MNNTATCLQRSFSWGMIKMSNFVELDEYCSNLLLLPNVSIHPNSFSLICNLLASKLYATSFRPAFQVYSLKVLAGHSMVDESGWYSIYWILSRLSLTFQIILQLLISD